LKEAINGESKHQTCSFPP